MVQKLRERSQGEGGFTLVELLVVMLILGLLAAIAIPSFFNQREKAKDADAKAAARTAQTAMETYATSNQGSYANAATPGFDIVAELQDIEPTLNDSDLSVPANAQETYTVAVTSEGSAGNVFSISRADTGVTSLTCENADGEAGDDGCPPGGNWGD
jgi:type IV pilus assembly protein PilA